MAIAQFFMVSIHHVLPLPRQFLVIKASSSLELPVCSVWGETHHEITQNGIPGNAETGKCFHLPRGSFYLRGPLVTLEPYFCIIQHKV